MGNSFGDRLRTERLSRSLTQAELGGDLYSASYVSLLENGRREPTPDVVKQLAKQLQLAPHAVQEWTSPVSEEEAGYLLTALYARQSWDMRDFVAAAKQAQTAAGMAQANRDTVSWWNMAYLQASSLLENADCEAAKETISEVLRHPLSQETAGLAVRAEQLLASACLGLGQLTEAVEHAAIAVRRGATLPHESNAYIAALRTLIAALAESGKLDEAWVHCQTLAALVDDTLLPQLAGEIYWVVGNVAFMRHDVKEGLSNHALAGQLLSPASDLALWARFNKATASVRLFAGVVEPDTLVAIERAELAQSVVGANPADVLEVSLIRAQWHYLNGDMKEALQLLTRLREHREQLAKHTAGEATFLLGRTLKAMGKGQEALDILTEAKELFSSAGAADKASLAMDSILEMRAAGKIH
ncbi:helix-turn-helix transcriptional regulator [Paenarthrobacter sp. Z7-10]|uniref:helix-turn-helix domain-containing protein n=1 Tax=Paenarthrobacter sp. Z7-10 TaxID=2787635 RepID=UPI0022A9D4AB|nr:helix-turn-helix transcriptional regulator [Paenarthrobacter sp. Z7-10]MCZ2401823.1 helix-turn-helix transcriptional regulator [Paenarthrobacter sp. Z7-10]